MSTTTAPGSALARVRLSGILRDICLWRKKKLSLSVLALSTAIWVLLEILDYKFLTVASWLGIFTVVALFLWANLAPLFGMEVPDLTGWEVSEETAVETAIAVRESQEEVIQRVLLHVVVQRDWLAFAKMVASLCALSIVGSWFDLLTLVYIGVLMGLTCPVIYVKYEDRMKEFAERARREMRRWYDIVDEKVVKRMRNKVVKEKKVE